MKKIIAFCAAGLITLSADAAILRLDFSGYVGKVSGSSGVPTIRESDVVAGELIQGDTVSGSYLIDTSEALLISFTPSLGLAVYRTFETNAASSTGPSLITASTFTVGGIAFSSGDITPAQTTSQFFVTDDPSRDGYRVNYQRVFSFISDFYFLGLDPQALPGNTNLTNGFGLDQPLSGAFLGNSAFNVFNYASQSTGTSLLLTYVLTDAQITEVSAVPLPAAVWLFGSGLIGLGALAHKKTAT